ncbi:hypothetical protein M9458_048272, partial [Cirrhinus mrigala]
MPGSYSPPSPPPQAEQSCSAFLTRSSQGDASDKTMRGLLSGHERQHSRFTRV